MGRSTANCSSRDAAERRHPVFHIVIPAKAGIRDSRLTNALDPRFRGDDEEGGYREAVPKPPPFENNPFLHCSAVVQTAGWNASHRPRPGGCLPTAASPSLPRPRGGSVPMAGRPKRRRISFARSKPWVWWERPQRPSGWAARRPIASVTAPVRPALPPHGIARFRWGARISIASLWIARSTALRPFAFSRAERSTSAAVPTWQLSMPPCAAKQSRPVPPRRQRRRNDGARPSLLSL